jgi:hypothetical protein
VVYHDARNGEYLRCWLRALALERCCERNLPHSVHLQQLRMFRSAEYVICRESLASPKQRANVADSGSRTVARADAASSEERPATDLSNNKKRFVAAPDIRRSVTQEIDRA